MDGALELLDEPGKTKAKALVSTFNDKTAPLPELEDMPEAEAHALVEEWNNIFKFVVEMASQQVKETPQFFD